MFVAAQCPTESARRIANGVWGGEHIGMLVTDTGATIESDCAAGVINQPLHLNAGGDFEWTGIHYIGQGGPIRIDQPPNAHPARYTGRAATGSMTLTLTLTDAAQPPQTFALTRGGNAHVFKCL